MSEILNKIIEITNNKAKNFILDQMSKEISMVYLENDLGNPYCVISFPERQYGMEAQAGAVIFNSSHPLLVGILSKEESEKNSMFVKLELLTTFIDPERNKIEKKYEDAVRDSPDYVVKVLKQIKLIPPIKIEAKLNKTTIEKFKFSYDKFIENYRAYEVFKKRKDNLKKISENAKFFNPYTGQNLRLLPGLPYFENKVNKFFSEISSYDSDMMLTYVNNVDFIKNMMKLSFEERYEMDMSLFMDSEPTFTDCLDILLGILQSLYVLNRYVGASHNDLHFGNILVSKRDSEVSDEIFIDSKKILIRKSKYKVALIDFTFVREIQFDKEKKFAVGNIIGDLRWTLNDYVSAGIDMVKQDEVEKYFNNPDTMISIDDLDNLYEKTMKNIHEIPTKYGWT